MTVASRHLAVPLFLLLPAVTATPSLAGKCGTWGGQCGDRNPGIPVPECINPATSEAALCTAPGAVRMWTASGFHPADVLQLPAKRDSTDRYQGICVPGEGSGTELFRGLDITGNYMLVAYNAGVMAWDVSSANAATPLWLDQKDGWLKKIWSFPPASEQLNYIQGISASDSSGVVYVVASGVNPVGTTLWELETSTKTLKQLFQDGAADSRDTRIFELGSNPYAVSVAAAGNNAVVFYDLAAARSLRNAGTKCCLNCQPTILWEAGALTSGCGGTVRLGTLPNVGALHRYVDVTVTGGKAYVVTANPLSSLRIWEISAPVDPGNAPTRFTGPTNVFAPTFIEVGSTVYLAWVKNKVLEIYNATSCLDGDGCSSLGSAVYTRTLRDVATAEQFLTVSTGTSGKRYLYYGCNGCRGLSGSAVEQLLDITALGPSGLEGSITEVTSGGGTYTDSCPEGSGPTVDYWGRYYPSNHYGINEVQPHVGMFKGDYFYRAAESILDVHVRGAGGGGGTPTLTTTPTAAAPYYLNSAIGFTASESSCDGSGAWQWNTTLTPSSGLGSTTASTSLVWPFCGGSRCADQPVEVWAVKSDCAAAENLVINKANLTLVDPRPEILSIQHVPNGASQPICTVFDLSATTVGKSPMTHAWTVRRAGVVGEAGIVATSSSAAWSWDTSGIVLGPELFLDGFESGDTGAWSDAQGLPAALAPSTKAAEKALSADFEIELVLNNSTNSPHTATETVTLSTLGALGFGAPAVTVVDLGGGAYRFTANSENGTEWRWEFADPANGSAAGCQFFALCQVYDFANDQQTVDFAWTPPNVPGNFGVVVTAANCEDTGGIFHSFVQSVPDIEAPAVPAMTGFYVNPLTPCSFDQFSGGYACPLNQAITFSVSATGSPTTYEIDWDGNGTFDQSIVAGAPVTHTYASFFAGFPRARAKNVGGASDAIYLRNPTNSVTSKLTAN